MKERDWPRIFMDIWIAVAIIVPFILVLMVLAKRHLGWFLWLGIE